jgi:hypothetical protein
MAAGVTDPFWSVEDVAALMDAAAQKPKGVGRTKSVKAEIQTHK